MKVNGEMVNKKEKEFIIIIKNHGKVIDMKVNIEIIKKGNIKIMDYKIFLIKQGVITSLLIRKVLIIYNTLDN